MGESRRRRGDLSRIWIRGDGRADEPLHPETEWALIDESGRALVVIMPDDCEDEESGDDSS